MDPIARSAAAGYKFWKSAVERRGGRKKDSPWSEIRESYPFLVPIMPKSIRLENPVGWVRCKIRLDIFKVIKDRIFSGEYRYRVDVVLLDEADNELEVLHSVESVRSFPRREGVRGVAAQAGQVAREQMDRKGEPERKIREIYKRHGKELI